MVFIGLIYKQKTDNNMISMLVAQLSGRKSEIIVNCLSIFQVVIQHLVVVASVVV